MLNHLKSGCVLALTVLTLFHITAGQVIVKQGPIYIELPPTTRMHPDVSGMFQVLLTDQVLTPFRFEIDAAVSTTRYANLYGVAIIYEKGAGIDNSLIDRSKKASYYVPYSDIKAQEYIRLQASTAVTNTDVFPKTSPLIAELAVLPIQSSTGLTANRNRVVRLGFWSDHTEFSKWYFECELVIQSNCGSVEVAPCGSDGSTDPKFNSKFFSFAMEAAGSSITTNFTVMPVPDSDNVKMPIPIDNPRRRWDLFYPPADLIAGNITDLRSLSIGGTEQCPKLPDTDDETPLSQRPRTTSISIKGGMVNQQLQTGYTVGARRRQFLPSNTTGVDDECTKFRIVVYDGTINGFGDTGVKQASCSKPLAERESCNELSTLIIVIISVCSFLFVVIVMICVGCYIQRRKNNQKKQEEREMVERAQNIRTAVERSKSTHGQKKKPRAVRVSNIWDMPPSMSQEGLRESQS